MTNRIAQCAQERVPGVLQNTPLLSARAGAARATVCGGISWVNWTANGTAVSHFATSQAAYESAAKVLFGSLDWLEARLVTRRYLLDNALTEADLRLFPTLVRFDAVYYGHFKCNVRHVYEYPALWGYTRELYQIDGIATVAIDEYKTHYYGSHRSINPAAIVPIGPVLDFTTPHGWALT